ncbi:MAG: flagellar biosynthetic protein FliO [Kofleriaceae bacterium]
MRFAFVLALLVPAVAHADGAVSFEVADHGDTVEVIAHNVEARTTHVSSVRSRIEVPVTGAPQAARMPSSDPTILFAELDGHALSVKTRLGYPEIKALAPFAKAQQIGSDLHLTFPRHAVVAAAATVAKPVVVEASAAPAPAVVETKKPDIKQAQAALAAATTSANPTAPAKLETKPAPATHTPIPPDHESTFGSPGLYGLGALVTLLACGYLMKKRKKEAAVVGSIDIIAQRSLGNKAKVMWLSAGGREVLVSVTAQNVHMLGQWSKSDREGMPRAATLGGSSFQQELAQQAVEAAPAPPAPPPMIQSSAVSGILKLRARTSAPLLARAGTVQPLPQINEDVATDDAEADLEWAKEILTASGARR